MKNKEKTPRKYEKQQEKKIIDTNLYHNLTIIMIGLDNLRRKKSKLIIKN